MISYSEETLQLTNWGRQDCKDMHSYGPGARPCYIIHYIVQGAGYLEYDRKRYRITAGESFLICPYVVARYYPDPDDPWIYTWVDFVGKEAPEYLAGCRMNRTHPTCPAIEASKILPFFNRLGEIDLYHNNKLEAGGILLTLLGIYRDAFPSPPDGAPSRTDDRLAVATTLIHSNYHHSYFNIEQLCRMMHCNRVTLYRLFQNGLNTSPGNYLTAWRMKQACKMLQMGMSVKTASLSCGFTDQFYFSRAFHRHMGMPPSEYKQQKQDF